MTHSTPTGMHMVLPDNRGGGGGTWLGYMVIASCLCIPHTLLPWQHIPSTSDSVPLQCHALLVTAPNHLSGCTPYKETGSVPVKYQAPREHNVMYSKEENGVLSMELKS